MKIIVDAFGGDNAPLEILKGCQEAVVEYGCEIVLTGDEEKIKSTASSNNIDLKNMTIVQVEDVISMDADPLSIMGENANCTMARGLKLLKEDGGDAFVSAGNTGALVVGSSFIVKRIKGIRKAALATIMPCDNGCYMLLDVGANLDCNPEMLSQFAFMGNIYMKNIIGVEKPRVGIANIGTEETKGYELQIETYKLLKNADLNFIGNVEPRDIPLGVADVVVADGFTGNIILKLTEGLGKFLISNLKAIFTKNIISKLAAILIMGSFKEFKQKLDYTEYGGAPLMGIAKPVFKAHGSSNAKAIKNAIRQAIAFTNKDVIGQIEQTLAKQAESREV